MAQLRKKGIAMLKVLFSALLIYFIFTKIPFNKVVAVLKTADVGYLLLALLFFICSKGVAALRLNQYFHYLNVLLTHISNIKLYLLGMFYNLFLPGGIGGDAFKGYLIKKKFEVSTKKVIAVLLVDRLSGLLLLFVFACCIALSLPYASLAPYKVYIGLSIPLVVLVFWGLNKRFFISVLPIFWRSLGYSALVQLAQLISVYFILKGLHVENQTAAYLFIFLISSIVSVLPLTLGGFGARELTFLYGATLFGLQENISVGISITFFFITAWVSLIGIYYHFKKPALTTIAS